MASRVVQALLSAVLIALPTLVFVSAATRRSLPVAALFAAVTATGTFVFKILKKQPLAPAIAGIVIATSCLVVALVQGQKRAFFLLPALVLPTAIAIACLSSILLRAPLAGVLLNSTAGGPESWRSIQDLRNLYTNVTWACLAVSAASGLLQKVFYGRNQLMALATVHILIPVAFSIIIAVCIAQVQRRTNTWHSHVSKTQSPIADR